MSVDALVVNCGEQGQEAGPGAVITPMSVRTESGQAVRGL